MLHVFRWSTSTIFGVDVNLRASLQSQKATKKPPEISAKTQAEKIIETFEVYYNDGKGGTLREAGS